MRVGSWISLATSLLTVVTFAFAITALPNSGRACQSDCASYPFASDLVASQFPGDYLWMLPAMVLVLLVVALAGAVHEQAPDDRRVFTLFALVLSAIAAAVLLIDYFVQFTVMPLNLAKGQLDGWALFTQYNANGVFLALEELGYLLTSGALLAMAPAFTGRTRPERALRWLLAGSFLATVAALVAVTAAFGLDRQDTFEIAVISIVWLTLLVGGVLMSVVFRRGLAAGRQGAWRPEVSPHLGD